MMPRTLCPSAIHEALLVNAVDHEASFPQPFERKTQQADTLTKGAQSGFSCHARVNYERNS